MQVFRSRDHHLDIAMAGAALFINERVLKRISSHWKVGGLFHHQELNRVAKYCVEHWRKHKEIPGDQGIYILAGELTDYGNKTDETGVVTYLNTIGGEVLDKGLLDGLTAKTLLGMVENQYLSGVSAKEGEQRQRLRDAGRYEESLDYKEPRIQLTSQSVSFAKIPTAPIDWLWEGYLARGELTLLEGLPATGKTTLELDIAARVSRGWKLPPAGNHFEGREVIRDPKKVLLIHGPEDSQDVISARLKAAGADTTKVRKLLKPLITLPQDIPLIEDEISSKRIELLIVTDSLLNLIGGSKVDNNAENHIRNILNPFIEMLRTYKVAAMGIRHFRKSEGLAIHRGIGSQAWSAISRLQLVVGKAEVDGDEELVLACAATRLGDPELTRSLTYRLEKAVIREPDPKKEGYFFDIETSRVVWGREVDVSADEISMGAPKKRGRPSRIPEIVQFIQDRLNDLRVPWQELFGMVKYSFNVGESTFRKACNEAGVLHEKDGMDGGWVCSLKKD